MASRKRLARRITLGLVVLLAGCGGAPLHPSGGDDGGCAEREAGTVCAASTCVGDQFQGARLCDGQGACGPAPLLRACAPYACNPANCLNACTSDLGCAAPAVCVSGSCR